MLTDQEIVGLNAQRAALRMAKKTANTKRYNRYKSRHFPQAPVTKKIKKKPHVKAAALPGKDGDVYSFAMRKLMGMPLGAIPAKVAAEAKRRKIPLAGLTAKKAPTA